MVKVDSFVKLHTLISLNAGKKNGYELMKELEGKLNKKVSAANIYPFLRELDNNKFVDYQTAGREKVYSLTKPGKRFVKDTLTKFHDIVKESLKQKITICIHCGCGVYDNKYTEKVNGRMLAFCCCHCASSYRKKARVKMMVR